MADLIVDPERFLLATALVDWSVVARGDKAREEAAKRADKGRMAQLRWLLDPNLGYPTQPFEVYRRRSVTAQIEQQLPVGDSTLTFTSLFGWTCYATPRPMVFIRADIIAGGSKTNVIAFSGAPFASAVVGVVHVPGGYQTVSFSGPRIGCIVLFEGTELIRWWGIEPTSVAKRGWDLIEEVGLPVDQGEWAGVLDLDGDQGLAGDPPQPPIAAALDRFSRGAAPIGWPGAMTPAVASPPWQQADPKAFLQAFGEDMLPGLKQMLQTLPPDQQFGFMANATLQVPGGDPAQASFSQLATMMFGAATDPVASLLMGFGTAYPDTELARTDERVPDQTVRSACDYMVTATFRDGIDGQSDPVVYAAVALAPAMATTPIAPANLRVAEQGLRVPDVADQPWRPVMKLTWDRLPPNLPLRSAAYAHARAAMDEPTATALIAARKHDGALQPIGASNSSDDTAAPPLLAASDDAYLLPGQPAVVPLHYGVTHQDIFGLWSAWTSADIDAAEPPVQRVAILSARLAPTPAPAACPATLTIDFSWDWQARTPAQVRFAARLFGKSSAGQAPPSTMVAAGMQKSLAGGAGAPFEVSFAANGIATPDAGGVIQYLTEDGRDFVASPPIVAGPRRYRLTVSGFSLDFSAFGYIGLQLWAMAVERRPPGRSGAWSTPATIVATADPRPPVIDVQHEDVLLASMEDAAGTHHAHITWPVSPGAVGYFIYTAEESKLRSDYRLPEAKLSQTLSQRLAQLRDAFAANPARRFFTRVNGTALASTSFEATLPRGSKDIHFFLIVGASAGNIESAWPDASDPNLRKRPIAYAAPRRLVPGAPTLEVTRRPDSAAGPNAFRADIRIETKPGALVDRIDLHRTSNPEAALSLDNMGPPILTIGPGQAGWSITPGPADPSLVAQPLGTMQGADRPAGSWKPFYYRAVAWSRDQLDRGILGGRSTPSAVRAVIVPPAAPPDLQPISRQPPPFGNPTVVLQAFTSAGVDTTPLGDHKVRVEVLGREGNTPFAPLLVWPSPGPQDIPGDPRLAAVPTAAPGSGSALWRTNAGGQGQLLVRIERPSIATELKLRIQLDDPLGRWTERVFEIAPDPVIVDPKFGPITVTHLPGRPYAANAPVNLSLDVPPEANYQLSWSFQPGFLLPGGLTGQGNRQPPKEQAAYADIPELLQGEVVQPPAATVIVRRAASRPGGVAIVFYASGPGWLSAELSAATGRKDSFFIFVGPNPSVLAPDFGVVTVADTPDGRHIVTAAVNLPAQPAANAGYQLHVSFRRAFLQSGVPITAGLPSATRDLAYLDVPLLRSGQDPFAGGGLLNVWRVVSTSGAAAIGFYVNGPGFLNVELRDVNGAKASFSETVG